jgi:DNA repair protein RadC
MHSTLPAEMAVLSEIQVPGTGDKDGSSAVVATILGRGRPSAAAVAAARRLIVHFGSAEALASASIEELRRGGRLSPLQARVLRASLLLAREIAAVPYQPGQRFANSRDLFHRYRARFLGATREYFISLHLNTKNQLIREVVVSVGSLSSSVVHPREVFSGAVRDSSAALIFLHNHPSGDPSPSREDRECTERLTRAGKILGIRVLDHIVLGRSEYFSFADAGLLRDGIRLHSFG